MDKTKGQVEAEISKAIIRFEKEYMGRGPLDTKTYIIGDMIFIRLKGVLTPAETQLAKTTEGSELIKKTRMQLLENAREILSMLIKEQAGCEVISLHSDISSKTGERVIIFTLADNIEEKFAK
jgi:uncharacterized protein YbcI